MNTTTPRTIRLRSSIVGFAVLILVSMVFWRHLVAADLRVTSIQITNNNVRITWDAPGGSNYVLQNAPRLSGNANTNFVDLSPVIFVPAPGVQSTSYTHVGGLLNSTSRFYRVRSFAAPPILQIQPTNAVIGLGMTNRYKVMAIYPDNSSQDVTATATLTSLNTGVAQVVGFATNGFILVRAVAAGTGSLRAVHQSITNTVNVSVSQLIGMYTVPPLSQISSYVEGQSTYVQVMGVFANGQTINITPASSLDGGAAFTTRVDYNVRADVANSFALITGQSAANGDILFTADDLQTDPIHVTWCKYTSVSLQPQFPEIVPGAAEQFSVLGHVANGTTVNVASFEVNSFTSSDDTIAQADASSLRVSCVAPGSVTITVEINNGAGCLDLFDIASLSVVPGPPVITAQPNSQTVLVGDDTGLGVTAAGVAPITYQWQFNGVDLNRATNADLTVTNVTFAQQGDYRVVAINPYGSVTSSVAILSVTDNPSGLQLWARRYNGPGNNYDVANAVAADANGSVIVTGYSYGTDSLSDYATVKYSSAGLALWTNRYNGPGNYYDEARAMAVDASGNVFVTGNSPGIGSADDYATIKYSSNGVALWTNRYNGPGNYFDQARAVAVDGSGNVFVTGFSTGSGSDYDYATIKYSSAGAALWTNRYNGPGNYTDRANAIAVDGSGNVLVTGSSRGDCCVGSEDYATIKYSSAGFALWTNRYNGPGNYSDEASAVAVDSSGNVYVTGYSASTNVYPYNDDYATIAYSDAGVPLWTNRYNGPGNGDDRANAVAVDGNGHVFVTGYSHSGSSVDYVTIAYSSAGVALWTNRYNGPGNRSGQANAIAVDGRGNVFVTGYSDSGSSGDYATVAYSSAGVALWTNRYHGPGNGYGWATAIAVDGVGNVFVTGYSPGSGGDYDYATVKYGSACSARNDNFIGRIVVIGSQVTTNASNRCASKEFGEPNHADNEGGKSLWWTWTAPTNGLVTISACGSDFDTLLAVYTGTAVNALGMVASNDDSSCSGLVTLQSQVQFIAVAGTNYQIAVDGYKYSTEPVARSGNIILTIQQ